MLKYPFILYHVMDIQFLIKSFECDAVQWQLRLRFPSPQLTGETEGSYITGDCINGYNSETGGQTAMETG